MSSKVEIVSVASTESLSTEKNPTHSFNKCTVWAMVLNATLGMFQFGYILTILNTLMIYFQKDVYHFTDQQKETYGSILNSVLTVGAGCGALIAGPITKKFGRRRSMICNDAVTIVASILTLIPSIGAFIFGRILGGVCIGFNSTVVPLYLNEITPLPIRGAAGAFNQIQVTFGALLAVCFGFALPTDGFSRAIGQWWRIMLGFPIVIALIRSVLLLVFFRYETPKYLIYNNQKEKAELSLRKIYKTECVAEQLQMLESVRQEEEKAGKIRFRDLFKKKWRLRLFLGCFIAFAQQMTGVNAFMFYSTDIFQTGRSNQAAVTLSTLLSVFNLLATLASGQILSRFGRKTILIWGDITITITIIATAILFLLNDVGPIVYPIFIFIILFGLTYGPIPWVIIAEILPDIGIGIAVVFSWLGALLVALLFPMLSNENVIGPGPSFFIFAALELIALVIIIKYVRETFGLTAAQINEKYEPKPISNTTSKTRKGQVDTKEELPSNDVVRVGADI